VSWLINSIPYILAGLAILLAFFQLRKEWDDYGKHKWLRRAVLLVLIVVGVLTFVSLHIENEEKRKASAKAELSFTFFPFDNPPSHLEAHLVQSKAFQIGADGSVHVEFMAVNLTDVNADNVDITVVMCKGCKFAKEPSGLGKLPGQSEDLRTLVVPNFHAWQTTPTISLDIVPPPLVSEFAVGFLYRCSSCVLTDQPVLGSVRILSR
jgi:hypothetical protein